MKQLFASCLVMIAAILAPTSCDSATNTGHTGSGSTRPSPNSITSPNPTPSDVVSDVPTPSTTPTPTPTPTLTPTTPPPKLPTRYSSSLNLAVSAQDILEHPVLEFLEPTQAMLRYDAFWRDAATPQPDSYLGETLTLTKAAERTSLIALNFAPSQYADPEVADDCENGANCGATANAAKDYAQFAHDVAVLCQKTGSTCHYELWNEPNIAQFWHPAANPAAYTKLACAAYTAIKQVNPTAIVVLGGFAPHRTDGPSYSPTDFLRQLYKNGIAGCFDAAAVHPYDGFDQAKAMHDLMTQHGDGGKQIWATELGFESDVLPTASANLVGAERARFERLIHDWQTLPFAGPAFWYTWSNDRLPDDVEHETYGLMTKSDKPKAIAAAFMAATA